MVSGGGGHLNRRRPHPVSMNRDSDVFPDEIEIESGGAAERRVCGVCGKGTSPADHSRAS